MKEGLHRKYIDFFQPGFCFQSFLTKLKLFNQKEVFDNYLTLQKPLDQNACR